MGFGFDFIHMIFTFFGKAFSKVLLNGDTTNSIPLKGCIKQGCPIVPLLYAITPNGLNRLVANMINKILV